MNSNTKLKYRADKQSFINTTSFYLSIQTVSHY